MKLLAALCTITSLISAGLLPTDLTPRNLNTLAARDPQTADGSCSNGPLTRACWDDGFSIATDFDQKSPRTGATVNYEFTITNGTCNPDGHGERICFLINGQYPGPVITANWGDTVVVKVNNELQNNGTTMHFHGVRQFGSCGSDGVAGVTQCPIAPGNSYTYSFVATQFGTSWYHSHFSNQYGDGVVGPMVFNGPASANYDIDLGPYTLSDWYYDTAYQVAAQTLYNFQSSGGPPSADNILINGTNKNAEGGGTYSSVSITSGKKYLLRLINISVDNYIRVSLDAHPLTVITSDFIPIKPFSTEWLLLGIGQRYDVVINANQTTGSYWFRANVATDCASGNANNGLAIWSYDSLQSLLDPTSTAFTSQSSCTEPSGIIPYWSQPVPSIDFATTSGKLNVNVTRSSVGPDGEVFVVWALNQTSLNVDWNNPTMSYLFNGNTNYSQDMSLVPTVSEGGWNYWLIQQTDGIPPIPHPIHLHGHDFFVLGQGDGQYSGESLNWNTPPRRDTATVYGGGWLAIAFESNNPGAWLLHCHIAWHISEGLGMQFLEQPDQIGFPNKDDYDSNCQAWGEYQSGMYYAKDDSGL